MKPLQSVGLSTVLIGMCFCVITRLPFHLGMLLYSYCGQQLTVMFLVLVAAQISVSIILKKYVNLLLKNDSCGIAADKTLKIYMHAGSTVIALTN